SPRVDCSFEKSHQGLSNRGSQTRNVFPHPFGSKQMKSPLTLTISKPSQEAIGEEKPVYPLSENEKALLSWLDHYFTDPQVLKQEEEEYRAVLNDLEKVKTQYQKTTYAYGSVAGASVVALLASLFLSGTIISVASGG